MSFRFAGGGEKSFTPDSFARKRFLLVPRRNDMIFLVFLSLVVIVVSYVSTGPLREEALRMVVFQKDLPPVLNQGFLRA